MDQRRYREEHNAEDAELSARKRSLEGESQAIMKTPRLPRKRLLLLGGSCAVLAASAVIFWQARRGAEAAPAAETTYFKSIGPHETPATKAVARDLRKQPVEAVVRNLTLRLTGSLAADDKSEVGSNAAGNVSETRVERGSFVKKGDVLVQIDPRDAQNALDEGLNAAEELRERLGLDESKEFCVDEVPEVEAAKVAMDLAERTFHRSENLKKAERDRPGKLRPVGYRLSCGRATLLPGPADGEAVESQLPVGRDAPGYAPQGGRRLHDPRARWTAGSPNGTSRSASGSSPCSPAPSW